MINYGRHLGTAFQLVDDALDFDATAEDLGKNIGDDLAEGKATLPLIYAMQNGSDVEEQDSFAIQFSKADSTTSIASLQALSGRLARCSTRR